MNEWSNKCKVFLNSNVPEKAKQRLRQSLDIVSEALESYNADEIAMSFNGGKDCLVMLVIILAVVSVPPKSIYIRNANSFKEVDEFVNDCAATYHLEVTVSDLQMKEALQVFLNSQPQIKAVFVGIRRADPWSEHLKHIQRTDHGWPDFIRIHPVLDWEYDDIWVFLKALNIRYCNLYDLGYTSLGSITNTIQNPSLALGNGTFKPAYELEDPNLERIGRLKN